MVIQIITCWFKFYCVLLERAHRVDGAFETNTLSVCVFVEHSPLWIKLIMKRESVHWWWQRQKKDKDILLPSDCFTTAQVMQKEAEQNIQPLTSTPNNLSSQEHMFRQNNHGKDLQKCHAMRQNTLSLTYAPPPPQLFYSRPLCVETSRNFSTSDRFVPYWAILKTRIFSFFVND